MWDQLDTFASEWKKLKTGDDFYNEWERLDKEILATKDKKERDLLKFKLSIFLDMKVFNKSS
jgi:hypothetical protein